MLLRVEPLSSEKAKMTPLRTGESEFNMVTGVVAYWIAYGLTDFSDWGPTPLRRVWSGKPFLGAMYARGDAGFNTVADLMGKRIPQSPASEAWSLNNTAILAFGGLTLDDVKIVTVTSIAAGLGGPLEGTVDATQGTLWSTFAQELAASRHGIKWFSMPAEDKEGWERLREVTPWAGPVTDTAAGLKEGETIVGAGYEQGVWALPTVSDDVVYAFCKALKDGYDVMAKMNPDLEAWTFDRAASLEGLAPIPYHEGTVEFMKDMGAWTPQHEQFQQEQLELEKQRLGQ